MTGTITLDELAAELQVQPAFARKRASYWVQNGVLFEEKQGDRYVLRVVEGDLARAVERGELPSASTGTVDPVVS